MSTKLARHPFGLHYIYLRLSVGFLRSIVTLTRWLAQGRSYHKLPDGVTCKHITVPSRDNGRHIKVHLYQSPGYDNTKSTPVLVNFHGSGFIFPALGSDREFCSLVAARTNVLVFDADYRKAPEHPFPAALQDVEDIIHYLAAHPSQYDPSNIFLSGFSAGGNLALVTASSFGPDAVKGVIGIYPSVDLTKRHMAPEKRFISGIVTPPFLRNLFRESYILPGQSRSDPRISPIFAPTESFPKFVYLACGNADGAYDPSVRFVERLREAGHSEAEFLGVENEAHSFDKRVKAGTKSAEKKDKVYAGAIDMINKALNARK